MIDYDKLKQAHALAVEYAIENNETCNIISTYYGSSNIKYYELHTYSHGHEKLLNIDELINRLKELIGPKPEYKDAWYLIGTQIRCTKVFNKIGYQFCDESDPESLGRIMYPSRDELIQSQIDYWTNLKL